MPLEPYQLPPATPENFNTYGLVFNNNSRSSAAINSFNNYGGLLPQYISPIRPQAYTAPSTSPNPFQYSVAPRNSFFDTVTGAFNTVAGLVRTGASVIGDATRTYGQLNTTVRNQVQDISSLPANRDTRNLTGADVPNSGNTLQIPYLLPQGVGNNTNTWIIGAGVLLLIVVLLMRK